MPYIESKRRRYIDLLREKLVPQVESAGEMNYAITTLLLDWMRYYREPEAPRYDDYNEVIGILECVKQEMYRREIAKYETQKCQENGDVFGEVQP